MIVRACACGSTHRRGEECPRRNARKYEQRKAHGRHTKRWRKLAAEAKARDGYRCQLCGSTESLGVHIRPELRGDHSAAMLEDCITYCQRCHGRVDGGRAGRGAPPSRETPAVVPLAPSPRENLDAKGGSPPVLVA